MSYIEMERVAKEAAREHARELAALWAVRIGALAVVVAIWALCV